MSGPDAAWAVSPKRRRQAAYAKIGPMQAPHRDIKAGNPREKLLIDLLDSLWEHYRGRMDYVRRYEKLVEQSGARFLNDHIAFRTISHQQPPAGILSISRIFEALGYRPMACYEFPDKRLSSIHYQHINPQFPKLFISQLNTWELPPTCRRIIGRCLNSQRPPFPDERLASLRAGDGKSIKRLLDYFRELPWEVPQKKDVEALNKESQFGAWVLVNGYDVNHFTASVEDIEKTVAAMKKTGIPMKAGIVGERGGKLRQSSTQAARIDVAVKSGKKTVKMPWTYAYFEIAERPLQGDGQRFEGFFGAQAAQLFEMTARRQPRG